MGSLLLAPVFLTFNSLLENKTKKCQIKDILALIVILTTLFLTLSRGSIFALLIAEVILIISLRSLKKFFSILGVTTISLVLALVAQGGLAVLGPTNPGFKDAIATSISQLTLGKAGEQTEPNSEFTEPSIAENAPAFTGYVEESTNRRLELATFATKVSLDNPTNMLFGTGLGSAGTEMYVRFPERQGHEKEIVQNEYLEAMLEIGLVGIIMLGLSIVTFIKLEAFKFEPYTFATIVAFAVTILFFSGFPNALHVYLLPVLWYNLMYDKNRISRA